MAVMELWTGASLPYLGVGPYCIFLLRRMPAIPWVFQQQKSLELDFPVAPLGGVQAFFRRIHFEHRALQVPLVIGETFGEDLGPRRPTGSKPRPA